MFLQELFNELEDIVASLEISQNNKAKALQLAEQLSESDKKMISIEDQGFLIKTGLYLPFKHTLKYYFRMSVLQ